MSPSISQELGTFAAKHQSQKDHFETGPFSDSDYSFQSDGFIPIKTDDLMIVSDRKAATDDRTY